MAAFDESLMIECSTCQQRLNEHLFSVTQRKKKSRAAIRCQNCVVSGRGDPTRNLRAIKAARRDEAFLSNQDLHFPLGILLFPSATCMNPECGESDCFKLMRFCCPFCRQVSTPRHGITACKGDNLCRFLAVRSHFLTPHCGRLLHVTEFSTYDFRSYSHDSWFIRIPRLAISLSHVHSLFVKNCSFSQDEPSYSILGKTWHHDYAVTLEDDAVLDFLIRCKGKLAFLFRGM